MKKIVVAIPHSHTWLWTQTCIASLLRNPPKAEDCECRIVVVDNSPWSPAIRGLDDTKRTDEKPNGFWGTHEPVTVTIAENYKGNRFHASALDCVVETMDFDYLMAWETDVLALRPTWLQWFVDQMRPTDFAVGMFHHEAFVNPSCTLYRGDVLRDMLVWCKTQAPQDELRWGPNFERTGPLDNNLPLSENPAEVLQGLKEWISGPFAEKRGFPQGTQLVNAWSGQEKGPGWFEPGQQLFHWATNQGHTYTACQTHTIERQKGMPVQTLYGGSASEELTLPELEASGAQTVHLWGGTRALDILKHPVTCGFVKGNTPYWLEREARLWKASVPADVQEQTLELIRKYGFHYRGQGSDHITERDREAAEFVKQQYANGGIVI